MAHPKDSSFAMVRFLNAILVAAVGATLLVPFVFTESTIYPFVMGKAIIFRLLIEGAFIFWVALLLVDARARPRRHPIYAALLIIVAVYLLATIFGVDRTHSFWGTNERMGGVFTFLHILLLIPIAVSVLRREAQWRRLFLWGLGTANVMALIGFVQYFSTTPIYLTAGGGKIWATLGNYIYLGQYSMFFALLAFWIAAEGGRKITRIAAFATGIVQTGILLLTETRGALLGFACGLLVLLALRWFRRAAAPGIPYRWRLVTGLLALAVGATVFFFGGTSDTFKTVPGIRRLTYEGLTQAVGGNATRLIGWHVALEAWQARPFFGWGPENYSYAWNKLYHPESLRYSLYETWFDRSHNGHLDALATTGSIGFLAIIFLYGSVIQTVIRSRRGGGKKILRADFAIAMFVAYLVQLAFVFDALSAQILMALFYAWVLHIGTEDERASGADTPKNDRDESVSRAPITAAFAVGVFGVAVAVIAWKGNILPLRKSRANLEVQRLLTVRKDPVAALAVYQKARSYRGPYDQDVVVNFTGQVTDYVLESADSKEAAALWRVALADSEAAVVRSPNDELLWLGYAQLLMRGTPFDPRALERAESALQVAVSRFPKRQQFYFLLGSVRNLSGKKQESYAAIKAAYDLDPVALPARWQYAVALAVIGRISEAHAEVQEIITLRDGRYDLHDAAEFNFVSELAFSVGDKAKGLWYRSREQAVLGNTVGAYETARNALNAGYVLLLWDDVFIYSDLARDNKDFVEAYRILREGTGSILNSYNEYEKHARYAEAAFAAGDRAAARSEALQALPGGRVRYRRRLEKILAD